MYGVKIYSVPADISGTIKRWLELGLDTIMTGRECLKNKDFIDAVRSAGIRLSIVEPIFLAPENKPEQELSVDQNGQIAHEDWVRFICPSDTEELEKVYARIAEDAKLGPDCLTLDFIRFFQFWEMTSPDADPKSFRKTCYCEKCQAVRKTFSSEEEWRCSVITSTVKKCVELIKNINQNIKIGIHIVPWKSEMFDGALKNINGQDLKEITKYVDFLAPMTYHHMIHQPVSYISELIKSHRNYISDSRPVIPSVQAKEIYRTDKLSVDEIADAIRSALDGSVSGITFYHWGDIEESPDVYNVIKDAIAKDKKDKAQFFNTSLCI